MAIIKSLKILTQPQGARYNATLSVQPVIQVGNLDTVTNAFTVDTAFVGSVLVIEGPGNSGYDLSGTLSVPFVSGVATFTNLGFVPDATNSTLDIKPASLSFVTTNLNEVTSITFSISNASKLVITSTPVPSSTVLNRVMQIPVVVQFRDSSDNNIALENIPIVATAVGATISGTTTLQSSSTGLVIFTQLTFSGGANVVVTFSSQGMTPAILSLNLQYLDIIKPRRSIFTGKTPIFGDLVPFEIAINIPDKKLWVADQTGTPVLINTGSSGSGGSSTFTSGATAPALPAQGDRWVNTTDAVLYTYYQTSWVQFNN